jgi:hypothetical protein
LVLSPLGNSDESFDADPGVSEWFGVVKRGWFLRECAGVERKKNSQTDKLTWFGARFSWPVHRHFDGFVVSGHLNWRRAHDDWQRETFTYAKKKLEKMLRPIHISATV